MDAYIDVSNGIPTQNPPVRTEVVQSCFTNGFLLRCTEPFMSRVTVSYEWLALNACGYEATKSAPNVITFLSSQILSPFHFYLIHSVSDYSNLFRFLEMIKGKAVYDSQVFPNYFPLSLLVMVSVGECV
jgi:hypothetical protein